MTSIFACAVVILAAAIFVEGSTEIVSKSALFGPLRRRWATPRDKGAEGVTDVPFLGQLVSCGHCLSVWVAMFPALVLAVYSGSFRWWFSPVAFIFATVIIHRLSNYVHNINDRYFDKFYNKK